MTASNVEVDAEPFAYFELLVEEHERLLEQEQGAFWPEGATAEIIRFVTRSRETGVRLRWLDERRSAQSIIDYWVSRLYRMGLMQISARLAPFDAAYAPTLLDAACPYVGLAAFNETTHNLFFGRAHFVAQLVERLRKAPLLAVVGRSGSGKSSVVRAGLIATLREGALPGSTEWKYLPTLFPGSDPLGSLARMLLSQVQANPAQIERFVARRVAAMRSDPTHLAKMIALVTPRPVVLVVDQFEELFTLSQNRVDQQAFATNLLSLIEPPESPHKLILTMRSEYDREMSALPELSRRFAAAQEKIPPLSEAELCEAIVAPGHKVGLTFDDTVVQRLIDETVWTPTSLPLLQFSLLQLWNERAGNRITLEVYERVGGGRQALARVAEEEYTTLLHEEQRIAERVLLQMVQPADPAQYDAGAHVEELPVTSRRVRRVDLYRPSGGDIEGTEAVLQKLINAGLIRTSGPFVEISHEALIRNWPRLDDWLRRDRALLLKRRHLRDAAQIWSDSARRPTALLGDTSLLDSVYFGDLTPLESEFLAASEQARAEAVRQQEEERQRANELALQRLRAEDQEKANRVLRRTNWRLRAAFMVIAVFAILIALLGFQLNNLWQIAIDEGDENAFLAETNEQLANDIFEQDRDARTAQSQLLSENNAQIITLATAQQNQTTLAGTITAQQVESSAQALIITTLSEAVGSAPPTLPTPILPTPTSNSVLPTDEAADLLRQAERALAAGDAERGLRLALDAARIDPNLEMDTLQEAVQRADPAVIDVAEDGPVASASWDRSGRYVVVSAGTNVRIFDRDNRRLALTVLRHNTVVTAAAWASNSDLVLTTDQQGTVRIWDVTRVLGTQIPGLPTAGDRTTDVRPRVVVSFSIFPSGQLLGGAWSPDDSSIVTGTGNRMALWRRAGSDWANTPSNPAVERNAAAKFSRNAWHPDGTAFVASGPQAAIWRVDSAEFLPLHTFPSEPAITSAAWSATGTYVVTAEGCNPPGPCQPAIRSIEAGNVADSPVMLNGHTALINDAMFDPNANYVVTASDDGTALVWPVNGGQPSLRLAGHEQGTRVVAATWNPRENLIVTGGSDGTVRIFFTERADLIQYAELLLTQLSAR